MQTFAALTGRFLIVALALVCFGAPARGLEFLRDVPKAYPTLFRSYQAMLPKEFADQAWLYRLDAMTLALEENVMVGGVPYLRMHGCKWHDCGDNQIALIFSSDGKTGAIKLRSELTDGQDVYYGSNDPALRRIIDRDL